MVEFKTSYIVVIIFIIFISIINIFSYWLIFKKTGRKGITSIIPIYNIWQLFIISNLKGWFSLVPLANILMYLVALYRLPKMFGKSNGFSILTVLFPYVCLPIIAFNKNLKYMGYIEEPLKEKKLYNEPVYKSDEQLDYNYSYEQNDTVEYKKVKSTKLKNKKTKININPIIDYSENNKESKNEDCEILDF